MRSPLRAAVASTALAALALTALQAPAAAAPTAHDGATASGAAARTDDRPGPRTREQRALRAAALEKLAKGKAQKNADGVVKLGERKHVEVETADADLIFTVLAEFGTAGDRKRGATPGPLHNEIAQPDRAVDNSTYWVEDFNRAHYVNLFNGPGESMKSYYEALSNGRYSVTNVVEDWVTVPHNGSYYGDNSVEDYGGAWQFVADAVDAWYAKQLASGRTAAEVDAHLAQFDVWDRYDFDGDGNFNESDGYVDHFQAVHAGQGEEGGGGEDAIWSHRWYVNGDDFGATGPRQDNLAGGTQIGGSRFWIGDYTTEPENGGLGVFAHEFGHDLGLPDYYDTSGGENSTAFWTLMSSGSWLGHGEAAGDGIGTTPGLMGPEEKLFLGWLDHSTVAVGRSGTYTLNPSQYHVSGKDQAVRVNLPDKTTSTYYATPPSGPLAWWTGSADDRNDSLTRPIPAGSTTVSAAAWYDIEAGYDYLYAEYSTDGGTAWTQVGTPVDGSSRGRWTTLRYSFTMPADGLFRFRYKTDSGVHLTGAFLDDIAVNGAVDPVAATGGAWSPSGLWSRSTGTDTRVTERYYLLENREYAGYDATLQTGPYQFSEAYTRPDWVEHFSFQNGMLVWYVDDSYADNNVAQHPGAGAAMVVDARPAPFTYPDGTRPSNRRQPFDATFGLEATEEVCLHKQVLKGTTVSSLEACAPSSAGIASFRDADPLAYWSSANPQGSVKVGGHGVVATVTGDAGTDLTVSVVNPRK